MRNSKRTACYASLAFILAAACAQTGAAQQTAAAADSETASAQVEDIVVTAQKREQRLQDVPIAVTALTGASLERSGVSTTIDLSTRVAGYVAQYRTGAYIPYLRGIGSVDPSAVNENIVSTYIDGVYLVSTPAALLALANVERIEVLKGPQGTLFGRNSLGGVVNIVTKTPSSTPEANVQAGYGNYGTFNAKGYLSGGIAPNLSVSVSGAYQHQADGWGTNVDTGNDVGYINYKSVSGKAYLDLGRTTATLAGDYSRSSSDLAVMLAPYYSRQLLPGGTIFQGGFYDDSGPDQTLAIVDQQGTSLKLAHEFDWANLLSISAFRHTKQRLAFDQDGAVARLQNVALRSTADDFTQEVQLTSAKSSAISWIVGAFYLHHRVSPVQTVTSGANVTTFDFSQVTESLAAYAQITAPLGERTNLTGGLRYTSDEQTFGKVQTVNGANIPVPAIDHSKRFNKLTWRVALDHKLDDDVMIYASYNRGYKSGLWNVLIPTPTTTNPEILDAYEVGIKSSLFDRKLRLNAAGFYYDYKNIQYNLVINATSQVQNAAAAHVQGLDIDGSIAASSQLRFDFGALWLWKRDYVRFPSGAAFAPVGTIVNGAPLACTTPYCAYSGNFTGNKILLAPAMSLTGAAEYSVPLSRGSLNLNANVAYTGKLYRTVDNRVVEPSTTVLGASIRWTLPGDKLSVAAWGKNLTGSKYHGFGSALAFGVVSGPAAPRLYGLTIDYKY